MSALQSLLQYYNKVTAAEAPEFHKTLEALAKKAEVAAPTVHFLKTDLESPTLEKILGYLIGVGAKGKDMIVGHKVLELFGAQNPTTPLSEEFSAVIAHELGHVKRNDMGSFGTKNLGLISPFVGVALAIGALAMLENYFRNKNKKRRPEEKLPGEEGYSHEEEKEERKHPLGWLLTSAKYLAAAVIGLVGGTFVMKTLNHHMEYSADQFSAKLMGSGKPLANALRMFGERGLQESVSVTESLRASEAPESTITRLKKLEQFIQRMMHPTLEKRIGRLSGI